MLKIPYPNLIDVKITNGKDSYNNSIVDEILTDVKCKLSYKNELIKNSQGVDSVVKGSVRLDNQLKETDLLVIDGIDRKIISIQSIEDTYGTRSHWRVYF